MTVSFRNSRQCLLQRILHLSVIIILLLFPLHECMLKHFHPTTECGAEVYFLKSVRLVDSSVGKMFAGQVFPSPHK